MLLRVRDLQDVSAAILRSSKRRARRGIDLVARASPSAASYLDWLRAANHITWGGPMNGQTRRQQLVRELIRHLDVAAVVETGTHRGTTTQFLWSLTGGPVFSVEADPRFHHFARRRLSSLRGVHLHLGDSRAFLRRLAHNESLPMRDVFFYLDAHWGEGFPLWDELELIRASWQDPIVMIDDFEVPGDPGYSFDDYGPGRRLTVDSLPPGVSDLALLSPRDRSHDETGARSGCCLLVGQARATALLEAGLPVRLSSPAAPELGARRPQPAGASRD